MSGEGEVARTTSDSLIDSTRQVDFLVANEYLWYLCGIDSSHHDMCRELVATNDGLRVRNDKGVERIHTDILDVDIAD